MLLGLFCSLGIRVGAGISLSFSREGGPALEVALSGFLGAITTL
jgi:hypothetical protein